jgi:thiamine pyrophosphate-dependent acetolactate synthase large subunit-like protein
MIRYECLEYLTTLVTDQLFLTSLSGQRIEWAHLSKHEGNLLVGQLGCATGVGIGLALALPRRKVIVLDSDGSTLLSLFNLPTLANLNPPNLGVFVFDNGVYSGSRISEPTATSGKTDLEAVATASGIENAVTVRDIESFKKVATKMMNEKQLHFVVCKVEESLKHREIPRPFIVESRGKDENFSQKNARNISMIEIIGEGRE